MKSRTEEIWIEKHKKKLGVSFLHDMNAVMLHLLTPGFLVATANKETSYMILVVYKNEFTVWYQLSKKICIYYILERNMSKY